MRLLLLILAFQEQATPPNVLVLKACMHVSARLAARKGLFDLTSEMLMSKNQTKAWPQDASCLNMPLPAELRFAPISPFFSPERAIKISQGQIPPFLWRQKQLDQFPSGSCGFPGVKPSDCCVCVAGASAPRPLLDFRLELRARPMSWDADRPGAWQREPLKGTWP